MPLSIRITAVICHQMSKANGSSFITVLALLLSLISSMNMLEASPIRIQNPEQFLRVYRNTSLNATFSMKTRDSNNDDKLSFGSLRSSTARGTHSIDGDTKSSSLWVFGSGVKDQKQEVSHYNQGVWNNMKGEEVGFAQSRSSLETSELHLSIDEKRRFNHELDIESHLHNSARQHNFSDKNNMLKQYKNSRYPLDSIHEITQNIPSNKNDLVSRMTRQDHIEFPLTNTGPRSRFRRSTSTRQYHPDHHTSSLLVRACESITEWVRLGEAEDIFGSRVQLLEEISPGVRQLFQLTSCSYSSNDRRDNKVFHSGRTLDSCHGIDSSRYSSSCLQDYAYVYGKIVSGNGDVGDSWRLIKIKSSCHCSVVPKHGHRSRLTRT